MSDPNRKENTVSNLKELIKVILSDEFDKLNVHRFKSNVPDKCLEESCILGVDEAGRGPVLGPMVYSVFYCPAKHVESLNDIGCTDSKKLTEKKRDNIFDQINKRNEILGWSVDVLSPNFISNNMLKRVKCSLNEIAQNSTVALIEDVLQKGVNLCEIYVDTIGPADKYQEKLSKLFPQCNVVVKNKADLLYPVVGAASICAKVIRDNIVQHWKFPESITISNKEFGSGYPGDPKTKKFLLQSKDDIFGFPNLVRFSWSTAANLLENSTTVEWHDENNDENSDEENPGVSSYFESLSGVNDDESFSFFEKRSLNNVDSL